MKSASWLLTLYTLSEMQTAETQAMIFDAGDGSEGLQENSLSASCSGMAMLVFGQVLHGISVNLLMLCTECEYVSNCFLIFSLHRKMIKSNYANIYF